MTLARCVATALTPLLLVAPVAGQGRSSATGGYAALSTARPAGTAGAGGGSVRTARPGTAGSAESSPSPHRITLPQPSTSPTTPASSSTRTASPAAAAVPVRTERFGYPPSTRSPGGVDTAVGRPDGRANGTSRHPRAAFRPGASANAAVPARASAARSEAGGVRAIPRPDSRYDVPRRGGHAPRYVAPGWRSGSSVHVIVVPRHVRPSVIGFAPYRRHCYTPSIGIGVYYGAAGFYPFGEIDSDYYDPPSDAALGGVRITGAPREAQVFVDGAYVGLVDDFDGPDEHLNLEPGPHRIEIHTPAAGAIAFDVVVQEGRTITLRAQVGAP